MYIYRLSMAILHKEMETFIIVLNSQIMIVSDMQNYYLDFHIYPPVNLATAEN